MNDEEHAAWWREREAAYRRRPAVQGEVARLRAATLEEADRDNAYADELERKIAAGQPGAQEALNAELTRQGVATWPPEPSAKDDPDEWRAFYQAVHGRDLPVNAAYQAEQHRIDAAAPADVGGLAAVYYETHYPNCDPAELTAEWRGITLEELLAERRAQEADSRDIEAGA